MQEESTAYQGKTFEIILRKIDDKGKSFSLEVARRSPGVRLIIVKGGKILLTKEYRFELKDFDYWLPGGKVFDSLLEYQKARADDEGMAQAVKRAALKECREETGLRAHDAAHYHTSIAGSTVQWDLHYFIVDDFVEGEQELEEEEIVHPQWMTFAQAKQLCLGGKISEDRSVGVLLRFLLNKQIEGQ